MRCSDAIQFQEEDVSPGSRLTLDYRGGTLCISWRGTTVIQAHRKHISDKKKSLLKNFILNIFTFSVLEDGKRSQIDGPERW